MRRRAHRAIDSGSEWARVEVRVDHRLPSECLLDPPRNGGHVDERRALAQHLICEQRRCSDPVAANRYPCTLTPKEPPSRDVSYFRLKLVDSLDVVIQSFFPIIFQPAHGDFRTVDLAARGAKHTLDVPPEDDKRAPSARIVLSVVQVQADAQRLAHMM